jgi:hypothetical protein
MWAFMVLRSTKEELLQLNADVCDAYPELIRGTRMPKALAELMETAEWRYAEFMRSQPTRRKVQRV